jgi:hypothetical protein
VFVANNEAFGVNIRASSIEITKALELSPPTGLPNVLTLGSLDDSAGDIVGITNFFATPGVTGIAPSDISVTAHSVLFDFTGSVWQGTGAQVQFDLVIGPSQPAPAPEPASLMLLGVGLAALGIGRRRKNA